MSPNELTLDAEAWPVVAEADDFPDGDLMWFVSVRRAEDGRMFVFAERLCLPTADRPKDDLGAGYLVMPGRPYAEVERKIRTAVRRVRARASSALASTCIARYKQCTINVI